MNKVVTGIILIFCTLMLLGCRVPVGKESMAKEEMPPSFPEEAETAPGKEIFQVVIADDKFQPTDLEIKVGDTIEWTNKDEIEQTVTFSDGFMDEKLPVGASGGYTFEKAGEYDYRCSLHPEMQGEVTLK